MTNLEKYEQAYSRAIIRLLKSPIECSGLIQQDTFLREY